MCTPLCSRRSDQRLARLAVYHLKHASVRDTNAVEGVRLTVCIFFTTSKVGRDHPLIHNALSFRSRSTMHRVLSQSNLYQTRRPISSLEAR